MCFVPCQGCPARGDVIDSSGPALSVEQVRPAEPAIPWHLCCWHLCRTQAQEMKGILYMITPILPTFPAGFDATVLVNITMTLCQDADGHMQYSVWHRDQKAVGHCLASILNLASEFKPRCIPVQPLPTAWTNEISSLSKDSFKRRWQGQ